MTTLIYQEISNLQEMVGVMGTDQLGVKLTLITALLWVDAMARLEGILVAGN